MTASHYRTATPNGVVVPSVVSPLSDMLRAPAYIKRGPQDQWILRIGNDKGKPQGQKAGVFLYCQEHGGEIATSGVCLETMERLVRNYGTDPQTTALVDSLDIFVLPFINADGSTYSIYDSPRRTNMSRWCEDTVMYPQNTVDPMYRNSYGVNINRNFSVGSVFDGFQGATQHGLRGQQLLRSVRVLRAGDPQRGLGPNQLPEHQVREQHPLLGQPLHVAARRVHASARGAAVPAVRDAELLRPDGEPRDQRDQGVPRHDDPASADGSRDRRPLLGRRQLGGRGVLQPRHHRLRLRDRHQPARAELRSEGVHQGMEFSAGNYGLLQSAFDYEKDTAAPVVGTDVTSDGKGTYTVKFTSNEASSIYYTTDGSTPTTASTEWAPPRPRALPLPLDLAPGTKLSWIAKDYKGNVSAAKSQILGQTDTPGTVGGSVGATLSLTLGTPAQFGAFTPGVTKTYPASTTANVISTAGDARSASPTRARPHRPPGQRRVLPPAAAAGPCPQRRQHRHRLQQRRLLGPPLNLLTYSGPISNDAVSLEFSQLVNAADALRTGAYNKALTFTLSTTTP